MTQRLWSALLLVVAYEGTRYVARALDLPAVAGVVAGLVYALSPRLLGAVGVLSGEVLPSAVLPWAVLPLVLARSGRLGPRQAGLWCGVAVVCMSGVNGAGVVAVVPLLLFLAFRRLRTPDGRRLAAWWCVAMAAACSWWVVPLLLLGRFSPPFLDYIETSDATTFSTSWSNSVRGTEHWLGYFTIGDQAWWPAAHQLATVPVLVLTTGLVAALGFTGLTHREMPLRGPLLASALVGLLCLTAGNAAVVGSLVDGPVRDLLDGPLAPLRNVHKADPLVRLPLALGAAHAVALLVRRDWRSAEARRWTAVGLAAVVLAGAAPLVSGTMRMPGFQAIPDAWVQTARFLDDQPGSRAIVLPGTGFGLQGWGWTIDEPMQGVAGSAWVTRSQVPLVPGPTARYLDTVERRVASGEGGPGLSTLLARGGITHVVLRRDLDPFVVETVPIDRAETALVNAPGLRRVAGFGSSGFGDQALIDVYAVEGPVSAVSLLDAAAVETLDGAPDDVLTALEAGVVDRETPVVVSADRDGAGRVVTDGYRRVERQFGRVHDAVSEVKSRKDPWITDRPVPDFPGAPGVGKATSELVDRDGPVLRVIASSSQGYADELGAVRPEFGAQSAVDGNGATEWRSGSFEPPDEQWLDLDLERPVLGGVVEAQFRNAPEVQVTRVRVRASTPHGEASAVYGVPPSGLLLAPLPLAPTTHLRLEVVEATGAGAATGQVRVSEVSLPGLASLRTLALPDPVDPGDSVVMRLDPPRRACVDLGLGPQCYESQARVGESAGRLDRTFELTGTGSWELSGNVVAAPGLASPALLASSTSSLRVRATSVLAGDPAVAGVFALDGNPGTVWLTESDTDRATLRLRWNGQLEVTGLSVFGAGGDTVTPVTALIRSGDVTRVVPLDLSSEVEPFVANGHLRVTFQRPRRVGSSNRPMGIGEVTIDGLGSLATAVDLTAPTGAVCGLGPEVRVDGIVHATEVSGSIDDVRLGRPLAWRVCDGPVELAAGRHRVEVASTAQFQPVELGWHPEPASADLASTAGRSERSISVHHWGATDRQVDVGPGPAAVLRVAENTNEGWRATLGGRELQTVVLDGWQQGYAVPAGDGGRITLTYVPDATYRTALLVGLVLAGLLVVGAAVGQLRGRRRPPVVQSSPGHALPRPSGLVARSAAGLGLLALGGPVAAAAYAAVVVRRVRPVAWAAGGFLLVLAAVAAALADGTSAGRPGVAADGLAAAGAGLLVGSALFRSVPPAPDTQRDRPSWRSLRRLVVTHRVLLAGLVLVAAQVVVRAVVVSGSWFWQDDFLHLDLSRTLGLSADFLVRDYSGHVEPGQYAVIWAIGQLGQGSFGPAVVVLVALQALASVLLLVLLQLLFGRSPWVLVPFAAYLFTPLALATATWLAAGLQAYPLQIAMLTSLIGLVRLDATGRRRWWVVSLLGHAVGLLFWEKAVLVLPTMLAVELLVMSAGWSVRERLRRVRRRGWFWVSHLVLLGAYVAAYLSVTASGALGASLERGVGPTLRDVVLRTFLPGVFGGPWSADGAASTIYTDTRPGLQVLFVALAVGTVAASFWRSGRAAWAGWALVVGYVAVDITLLLLGRGSYLLLVSRDPRYVTDALPVLAIGVCAAFCGGAARAPAGLRGTGSRRSADRPMLALLAVAVVAASGLLTTVRLTPAVQHRQSEEYVGNLSSGFEAAPGGSVLTSPVPSDVSISVSLPSLLRAVWLEQMLDRPGTRPQLVAPDGTLIAVDLADVDLDRRGPVPDCGWNVGAAPVPLVFLPAPGPGDRLLRLRYLTGRSGVLHVAVGDVEQAVEYPAGAGEVWFVVSGQTGPVHAWRTGTADGICITDLQRGVPVPAL